MSDVIQLDQARGRPRIGKELNPDRATEQTPSRAAKDHLQAFVERIERLNVERKEIGDDIREVFAEAKANGYDVKALRAIIRLRAQDPNERAEQETILETYMQALGML